MNIIPNLYKSKPIEPIFVHAVPSEDGTRMVGKIVGKLDASGQPVDEAFDCPKAQFDADFSQMSVDPNPPVVSLGNVINPGDPGFEEAMAAHKASLEAAVAEKAAITANAELEQATSTVAGDAAHPTVNN